MATVADILNDCRLFSKVEPRGFARLVAMARLVKFDKGQLIFRDGDACPGAYVVSEGMVRVFKTSPSGKEHVLHIVGPGARSRRLRPSGSSTSRPAPKPSSRRSACSCPRPRFTRPSKKTTSFAWA